MKKNILLLSLTIALMFSLSIVATAQDSINTVDANLYSIPNILPNAAASPFGMNIRTNPALIDMEGDHEFIYDFSYFGSTSSVSMDMRNAWDPALPFPNGMSYATGDLDYQAHLFSTDIGFIKSFGIHSLGLIFNYSYFTLDGDGSFSIGYSVGGGGAVGSGISDSTAKTHNYSLSLLDNIEFSDAFSLGLGLTYAYGREALTFDVSSSWYDGLVPAPGLETNSQAREMDFSRHLISPTIGISFSPSDSFVLNGNLSLGFTVGSVSKKSDLAGNLVPMLPPYREDMDSNDLFGFSIDASIEPKYRHSDTLSFPFLVDFSYSDMEWKVDGVATGVFAPITFLGIFQGPGTIEYENNTRSWDLTAGAGVVYTFKGIDLKSLLSYTHENIYNSYYQYNVVSGTGPGGADGPNAYSNRVGVTRDILSIELGAKKEFSPAFSADFGLVYNISWGRIDYYQSYLSTLDFMVLPALPAGREITTDTYVKGIYHDLTLRTELAYTPVENLTIGFSGMVKFPIYGDIYEMGGSVTGGIPAMPPGPPVRPTIWWNGASSYEYDIKSLEYGGILNITYEF